MQARWPIVVLTLFIVPGARAVPESPPADDPVLATYRGGSVTASELRQAREAARSDSDAVPTREELEGVALRELLVAQADATTPRAAFLLAELESRILASELRKRLDREIRVPEERISALLASDPTFLHRPRKVQLRNLTLKYPSAATDVERLGVRARMEAIRNRLLAGADFARVAGTESESESRLRGGHLGAIAPGQLAPRLESVAFALSPGEISAILEVPEGLTIFKCDGFVPEQTWTPVEARARATEQLRRREGEERWADRVRHWLDAARPGYFLGDIGTGDDATVVATFMKESRSLGELAWLLERAVDRPELDSAPPERLRLVLEQHIVQAMAAREARSLGLGDDGEYRSRLDRQRRTLLAAEALRDRATARFREATEAELRAYFSARAKRFVHPDAYRIAAIRWPLDETGVRPRYRHAEEVLARVRTGAVSFAEAAAGEPSLPAGDRSGEIGWLDRRQLAAYGPNLFHAVIELEVGAVGGPVRQDDGLWIVHLLDSRPSRAMSFEEAKRLVRRMEAAERLRRLERELSAELAAQLELKIESVPADPESAGKGSEAGTAASPAPSAAVTRSRTR